MTQPKETAEVRGQSFEQHIDRRHTHTHTHTHTHRNTNTHTHTKRETLIDCYRLSFAFWQYLIVLGL